MVVRRNRSTFSSGLVLNAAPNAPPGISSSQAISIVEQQEPGRFSTATSVQAILGSTSDTYLQGQSPPPAYGVWVVSIANACIPMVPGSCDSTHQALFVYVNAQTGEITGEATG